jgi:hypothetical protein
MSRKLYKLYKLFKTVYLGAVNRLVGNRFARVLGQGMISNTRQPGVAGALIALLMNLLD